MKHYFNRTVGQMLVSLSVLTTAYASATSDGAPAPATRLDALVVTGTRTAQQVRDVPVRTELLSSEDLRPIAPRTFADTLEYITGVRIENDCQNCNFAQIRLLGLEGGYSQVLVDGQPLISALASVYAVEQLPASLIDRVEVVKGGGSALYGPGSIGGVVNLIPRTPTRNGLRVTTLAEDIKGTNISSKSPGFSFSTSIQADLVLDRTQTAVTIYGQGDRSLPLDLTGDGYSELGFKELSAGGARIDQLFASVRGRLVVDLNHSFENRRGGNRIDSFESDADVAESIQSTRSTGSISWTQVLGEHFDYRLGVSHARTSRDSYYGSGRDPNAFGSTKDPLTVFDTQFNHALGNHTLSWGVQRNEEHLTDVQPAYSRQTDSRYVNTGVFLQDEWAITKSFDLLFGARGDDTNQMDKKVVSPRVALRWAPVHDWTFRASFASGFRAPQVFDEDLHVTQVGGTGAIILNDPSLTEERAQSLNFEVQRELHALGANWLFEGNVFHTRIKNSFILEEDTAASNSDETVFIRRNGGGSRIYGLEANVGAVFGRRLRVSGGYVIQRSLYDSAQSPLDGVSSRRLQRTPDEYAQCVLDTATPIKNVRAFVGLKYTGPMEVPHAVPDAADVPVDYPWTYGDKNSITRSKRFWVLDASCSYSTPFEWFKREAELTLRLGVRNLLNSYQSDFDQGEFRDSAYVYGPRQPRSFFVSTEFAF